MGHLGFIVLCVGLCVIPDMSHVSAEHEDAESTNLLYLFIEMLMRVVYKHMKLEYRETPRAQYPYVASTCSVSRR